jgi:putative acetyltransferase
LVQEAVELCRLQDELIVLVVGHPDYYPRFGFSAERAARVVIPFELENPDAFMALELKLGALEYVKGRVRYPKAFGVDPA